MDELTTTLPEQSSGTETPAQATETGKEIPSQPQQTGDSQVEGTEPKPQATEPQRGRASDYYRERKRIRDLEDTVRNLNQRLEESLSTKSKTPEVPAGTKYKPEDFYANGHQILSDVERNLMEKIEKLESQITTREQSELQAKMEAGKQEAMELLFPKSGSDDEADWRERAERNQDRVKKIWKVIKEYGLEDQLDRKPKETSGLILKLIDLPAVNPTVLPKKLMGGSAKGTPPSSGKSPKELKYAELRKLSDEASSNPELRGDPKHKERRMQLIREIEMLETEERK